MATTFITIVDAKFISASQVIEYTCLEVTGSTVTTVLDDFVVINNGSVTATFSVWLVKSGEIAADYNRLINARSMEPSQPGDECAEIVGQNIQVGDFLVFQASVASTLTVRGSGRLIVT